MTPEILESYRLLAMKGEQGQKSEAIRVLCDEIALLQKRQGRRNGTGFVAPTMEEIKGYARERKVHELSACEDFRDHFESNGWMAGRVKMVDWKAAFRRWTRKMHNGFATEMIREHSTSPGNGKRYGVG